MKRLLAILLFVVAITPSADACEGEKLAKLFNVAVSRCIHRTVVLSFDREGQEREFVMLDDKDARRIYDTLRPYYEGK